MKKILIVLLSLIALSGYSQTGSSFTQLLTDFSAPNKGAQNWGLHTWNDITQPTIPTGNSVAKNYYTRFNWRDIESSTTQGSYTWTVFDNYVNQAIDAGAMFTFGVMPLCDGCGTGGAIPQYVINLMTNEGKAGPVIGGVVYPNYQSTNWKTRYCALLRACANHIATTSRNGKPYSSAFAGFDLRHAGNFGEFADLYNNAQYGAGAQVTDTYSNAMVDSSKAIFPNVQLTIPMGYFTQNGNLYGNSNGAPGQASAYKVLTDSNAFGRIGWRRDNIGDDGYNVYFTGNTGSYNPGTGSVSFLPLIMNMWKLAPIGGEPSTSQSGVSRCGSIYCDMHNEDTLFHMSSFGNGNAPAGVSNASGATWTTLQANWRAASAEQGYKLVLDSAITTSVPITTGTFSITTYIKNIGLAPVYERWNWIYELRNPTTSAVVWRDTSAFKPRLFLPKTTDSIQNDTYTLPGIAAGTYNLYLIIKDPVGYKAPLPLAITGRQADGSYLIRAGIAVTTSAAPVANAGSNQTITLPTNSVTLNGSASAGTITSYAWTRVSGPNTPTIVTPTTVSTSVTGLIQGTYVFRLTLNGGSTSDVQITVNPAPPPTANAGPDLTITLPTSSATLDGSGTTGTITNYSWSFLTGPNTPTILSVTSATTGVTGLIAGTYTFQLSVNSGVSADQVSVTVNPAPTVVSNIFTSQTPAGALGDDGNKIEVGVKFRSTVAGYITGVRFYKQTGNSGTHIGELYSSTGTRLAQATFTGETASGWQTVLFSSPVLISANVTYVAAYYSPNNKYSSTTNSFGSAVVNGNLSAISDGTDGPNGVYIYTTTPAFPTSFFNATNYWVDVVFTVANSSHVIGTGSGSYSLTSMAGLIPGDTVLLATQTGTVTSVTIKDVHDLFVMPQSGRIKTSRLNQACRLKNMIVTGIDGVSDGSSTIAWDMTCGRIDSSYFGGMFYDGYSTSIFNSSTGGTAITYVYGVDTTYKQNGNIYDSIKYIRSGRLFNGTSGYSGVTKKDVDNDLTFSRIIDEATASTSFEGIGVSGICFGCTAHDILITSTTQRGASGDLGWLFTTGWWTYWNIRKDGGPGYIARLFPLMEYRRPGRIIGWNLAKANSTQYGGVNYQFNAVDSAAGQFKGTSGETWNMTIINQNNDDNGYWSPAVNHGTCAPGESYPTHNILGVNIGENNNNAGKPKLISNLCGNCWPTMGTDTSNNQYFSTNAIAQLDTVTTLVTNSLGSFKAYKLTANTPGIALGGGLQNPYTLVDYLGAPYRYPAPDLGYIQFSGAVAPSCNCLILRRGTKKVLP